MDMLVALGIAYAVLGLLLAGRPLTAARAVNHLRHAPFSARYEALYRGTGLVVTAFGLILAGVAMAAG